MMDVSARMDAIVEQVEERHALEDFAKICDPQHDRKRQARLKPRPLATLGDKIREAQDRARRAT